MPRRRAGRAAAKDEAGAEGPLTPVEGMDDGGGRATLWQGVGRLPLLRVKGGLQEPFRVGDVYIGGEEDLNTPILKDPTQRTQYKGKGIFMNVL